MTQAMHRLAEQAHPAFPVTIYYAFKQQEVKEDSKRAMRLIPISLLTPLHSLLSPAGRPSWTP
jgi:adenine-specific DNA methylase